jgi:hypothetical protein
MMAWHVIKAGQNCSIRREELLEQWNIKLVLVSFRDYSTTFLLFSSVEVANYIISNVCITFC